MDDARTPYPVLTDLARRTGVPEYRLGMAATLLALPAVSSALAAIIALF